MEGWPVGRACPRIGMGEPRRASRRRVPTSGRSVFGRRRTGGGPDPGAGRDVPPGPKKIPAATGQFAAGLEDCLGPLSPLSHSEAPSSISLLLRPLSRVSLSVLQTRRSLLLYAGLCRCRIGNYRLRQGQCTGWRRFVKGDTRFGGKKRKKPIRRTLPVKTGKTFGKSTRSRVLPHAI